VGCSILAKVIYGEDVNITYCNYNDVNEIIGKFLNEDNVASYDKVFITDISINEEMARLIDDTYKHFVLLDHHQTALWLNKYSWATVQEYLLTGDKHCGTHLLFQYFYEQGDLFNHLTNVFNFSTIVRKYDTFEWKYKYNDFVPKQFNDLLYILGRDRFIEEMVKRIFSPFDIGLIEVDLTLLELNQEKIDHYIESKSKQIIEMGIAGYKAGVVFAEQYISELGNKLSETNSHLDFIAIVNLSQSISYRTVKDNINLGVDIAKCYGGGGHPKAAGSEISNDLKLKILDLLFE
jgi:oligoribonuclease NrnB/cAMP/cGMP phosphodiesterase (DHH superfamily)